MEGSLKQSSRSQLGLEVENKIKELIKSKLIEELFIFELI